MKRIFIIILIIFMLAGCSSNTVKEEVNGSQTVKDDVIESIYPKELNEVEIEEFINNLVGFWPSYEFPHFQRCSDEYGELVEYVGCHTMEITNDSTIYHSTYDYDIHFADGNCTISYKYKIQKIQQVSDNEYHLSLENTAYVYPNDDREGNHVIYPMVIKQIDNENKTFIASFKNSYDDEIEYFLSSEFSYKPYIKWLEDNDYIVDFSWINEIYPNGLCDGSVSLYKAKEIVESVGLVFDTDIPESDWNNPKYYSFEYVVDGIKFYKYPIYGIKIGTVLFFSYH